MLVAGEASRTPPPDNATPIGWRLAEREVDLIRARVQRGAEIQNLDRSGCLLLDCLIHRVGEVVNKEQLLRVGWPGRVVGENSLAKAIGKLRRALGDEQGELIQSAHGFGYRLATTVEPIFATASVSAGRDAHDLGLEARRRRRWPLIVASTCAGLLILLALAATGHLSRSDTAPSAAQPRPADGLDVVAVLPIVDTSENGSLQMFGDGVANYLRDQLQRVSGLRLISRADSVTQRHATDWQEVGRELGANVILGGEVSSSDTRLVVSLRLLDTSGRIPPWSQRFERAATDQATLLNDMTAALLAALGDQPNRWGHVADSGQGTANREAYLTFVRASTLFAGNNDPNSQRRAISILEQAIELDPDYADALLMLGGILGGSGYYADSVEELAAGRVRAIATMDRGIALKPADPLNYLLRSEMRLLYRHDWKGALQDIDQAVARTPGGESAAIRVWEARLRASQGRIDEAIALDARAIALDPQSGARRNQGWHYLAKRDTANARAVLMLQLEDLPENPHVNFYLALCDIFDQQPDAALRRLEYSSTLFRLLGTAIAQHERGDKAASDQALQALTDRYTPADAYWVAAAHAWRGEIDPAFDWLDAALRAGDSSLMYLAFDPLMENLRGDARYRQLLIRLGIEPAAGGEPALSQN